MIHVKTTVMPDGRVVSLSYREDGAKIGERWSLNQLPDRQDDLPAIVQYDATTGKVLSEEWWKNGVCNRVSKPASIEYDLDTGNVVEEKWIRDGRYFREDGPSFIKRDAYTGAITYEEWTIDGKKGRMEGPAVIYRDASFHVMGEEWWDAGKFIEEKKYQRFTKIYHTAPWNWDSFTLK